MTTPTLRTSRRLTTIEGSATVGLADRLADLRRAGRPVVNLASGDPDFNTPAHITAAAVTSLQAGRTHYGPSRGTPELRSAVAAALPTPDSRDPDTEVLVTGSAKFALSLALQAILDPGDEVVVLTPAWVSYIPLIRLHGGVPALVHLSADTGFRITAEALRAACGPRTAAILLNSPTNPTGRVLDRAEVGAVVAVAEERDLVIVSDEIYRHLVFEGPHLSPAALAPDRTVVVDGVSKAYAMTGWRLGWLTGPRDIVDAALIAHQHMLSCVPVFVQDAAVAALTGSQDCVTTMLASYAHRRRLLIASLRGAAEVRFEPPQGTFYAYLDIGGTGSDSAAFSAALLDAAGVAVLPGRPFGGGDRHVRLSLAVPTEQLTAGLDAMAAFLAGPHLPKAPR